VGVVSLAPTVASGALASAGDSVGVVPLTLAGVVGDSVTEIFVGLALLQAVNASVNITRIPKINFLLMFFSFVV
jgi:hypothetical protein